jgi:flagellar hook-basal body complex protein FliE
VKAINSVTDIPALSQIKPNAAIKNGTIKENPKNSFGETMKEFLTAVQEIITGQSQNLAEAMTALEESRLSFQLMLEIRNKLVESYQEISRMQI